MYQKEPQGSIFPGHPGAESYPNSWKKQWLKKLSQHYPPPSLPTATTSSQDHSYSRPTPRIPGQNSDNPQPHFPNTHRKTTTLSLLYSSDRPLGRRLAKFLLKRVTSEGQLKASLQLRKGFKHYPRR